jgi:tRNA(fMet)-specific endonuclease VapC
VEVNLLVDTNRYRDFCEDVPEVVEGFRRAGKVWLPFIVVGELRAGFAHGTRVQRNEEVLAKFLSRSRTGVLFADDQTTHHYARLYNQLRTQGTPIPSNDLWIAALVVQHNLFLYTRDQHFDKLPQLPRV